MDYCRLGDWWDEKRKKRCAGMDGEREATPNRMVQELASAEEGKDIHFEQLSCEIARNIV